MDNVLYVRKHNIVPLLNEMLTQLVTLKPEDELECLIEMLHEIEVAIPGELVVARENHKVRTERTRQLQLRTAESKGRRVILHEQQSERSSIMGFSAVIQMLHEEAVIRLEIERHQGVVRQGYLMDLDVELEHTLLARSLVETAFLSVSRRNSEVDERGILDVLVSSQTPALHVLSTTMRQLRNTQYLRCLATDSTPALSELLESHVQTVFPVPPMTDEVEGAMAQE